MRVGLTYDLRDDYLRDGWGAEESAEFDSLETVEAVESALRSLGFLTDRIGHIRELARRLTHGDRWDIVFNFAEGARGYGREAQVPALLDAFDVPYTFSDPLVLALTLHKGLTKRVIRDHGLPTPDFALVEEEADIARIALPFPLFAKPVAAGSSIGIGPASRVSSPDELATTCRQLLRQFRQPVLVETYLPGREITVGIIGTGAAARVVGIMEVHLGNAIDPHAYSYENKQTWEGRVAFDVVTGERAEEAGELALAAWRALGCRDAGRVDLRADAHDRLHFLEVNPLAGLRPGYSDLCIACDLHGITYETLIQSIMDSALERVVGPRVTA